MKKKRITQLEIREGSLVDHPANPHAVMVLHKALEPDQLELLRTKLESLRATLAPHLDDDTIGDTAVLVDEAAVEMLGMLGGVDVADAPHGAAEQVSARLYAAPSGGVGTVKETKMNDTIEKIIKDAGRYDRDQVHEAMVGLALKLEPTLPPAQAMLKRAQDPTMRKLYEVYRRAPEAKRSEPVMKVALPGDRTWSEIKKLAQAEWDKDPRQTEAETIQLVLTKHPELYTAYKAEQAAGR